MFRVLKNILLVGTVTEDRHPRWIDAELAGARR